MHGYDLVDPAQVWSTLQTQLPVTHIPADSGKADLWLPFCLGGHESRAKTLSRPSLPAGLQPTVRLFRDAQYMQPPGQQADGNGPVERGPACGPGPARSNPVCPGR